MPPDATQSPDVIIRVAGAALAHLRKGVPGLLSFQLTSHDGRERAEFGGLGAQAVELLEHAVAAWGGRGHGLFHHGLAALAMG